MTEAEYRALPAINASAICAGMKSMKHMHHSMTGGERPDTAAMSWGRKVHKAILEPDRFFAELAVWDGARRSGPAWIAFCEEYPDADAHATPDELARLTAMSREIWRNTDAADLLHGGESEKVITWQTDEYGAAKGRVDMLNRRRRAIIDLKTTRDAEPDAFCRSGERLYYHVKMGWYWRGAKLALGMDCLVYLVVIESVPPYGMFVCEMPNPILQAGADAGTGIAKHYRCCEMLGTYPDITDGAIIEYERPAWVANSEVDMEGVEDE